MLLLRQCPEPILHILFCPVLGEAVALLNLALQLVLPSVDYVEVIVGEPTPLLLGSALELFPVPFDSIPVHGAIAPSVFRCPGANRSTNKKFRSRVRRTSIQLVGTARLLNPLKEADVSRDLVSSRPRSSCRTAGPSLTAEP